MPATYYIRIIAVLFILSGLGAVWTTISHLFSGSLTVGAGLLNLFVGIGLWRYRPFWRKVAMVLLALGLVFSPMIAAAIMFTSMPVSWFGTPLTGASRQIAALVIPAFFMVVAGAQLWVLRRRDVKAIFDATVVA